MLFLCLRFSSFLRSSFLFRDSPTERGATTRRSRFWMAHHSEATDGIRGNTLLYLLQVLLMKSNLTASSVLAKFSITFYLREEAGKFMNVYM